MYKISLIVLLCICAYAVRSAGGTVPREHFAREVFIDSIFTGAPFYLQDSTAIFSLFNNEYKETENEEYLQNSALLRQYYALIINYKDTQALAAIDKFPALYAKTHPNVAARALAILAENTFSIQKYERAFDYYLQLEELANIYGYRIITAMPLYFAQIGKAYYKFKDYQKVIELMRKLLETPGDIGAVYYYGHWTAYNDLGLCYRELGNIASSTYYFQQAAAHPDPGMRKLTYSIAIGNVGDNYYLAGRYNEAIPLIQHDLEAALNKPYDYGLACGAAIPLAHMYIKKGELQKADSLLKLACKWVNIAGQYERLRQLFPVVSEYYFVKHNYALANGYKDSAIAAIYHNDSVFNMLVLMRVKQRRNLEILRDEQSNFAVYRKLANAKLIGAGIILLFVIIIFVIAIRFRNKTKKDKQQIEELKNIIELRQRISADMHDDIGSTLSSISIYTHSLLLQPQQDKQKKILEKIRSNAQCVQENLSDIIWSVDPNMDTMEQVLARMRAFGADITENAGIKFRFDEDEAARSLTLDMIAKKNLYFIYKEAVNNAVKYSECKHISTEIKLSGDHKLQMQITDDGKGFDINKNRSGNGLKNMQRRAAEMNASFLADSTLQGTRIYVSLS